MLTTRGTLHLFLAYVKNETNCENEQKKCVGSGGIRTHASEETGALNQRLRPLGHATYYVLCPLQI
mgnify:CR=1 FL=1